jgi:hypothetical protein
VIHGNCSHEPPFGYDRQHKQSLRLQDFTIVGVDVTDVLTCLQHLLMPSTRLGELELADEVCWENGAWLEYRGSDIAGSFLLDISDVPMDMEHAILAEMWRPAWLRDAVRDGAVERAVERRLVWYHQNETNPEDLARHVAVAVRAWIAAPDGSNAA